MSGRVALISMTRDRLDFTKFCFERLQEMAGYPFDHYVIDNGSEDGTQDWLKDSSIRFENVDLTFLQENRGISVASVLGGQRLSMGDYVTGPGATSGATAAGGR